MIDKKRERSIDVTSQQIRGRNKWKRKAEVGPSYTWPLNAKVVRSSGTTQRQVNEEPLIWLTVR
ncbi:hypothetical protein Csa_004099 [Cucumis sativus]|uniref:Uncharacterized protein n=1 Tax=Cucumis sativus TaxID=3659 RepID=A0A0A0KK67_CUCSA|nr:hypothetical protein Csa_004099 [Cucumis sativus]